MTELYPSFGPIHRLGLGIIRDWFEGVVVQGRPVTIGSRIPADLSDSMPLVMIRSDRRSGGDTRRSGDERFLRSSLLSVETFTVGLNAESDGYNIQESVRLGLWDAWRNQTSVPGAGSLARIITSSDASLVSDYATSTGVVQYASLPKGAARTESIFQVFVRPPAQSTLDNPYIPSRYL